MAQEQRHPPVTWEYRRRSNATFEQLGWGVAKIDQWHAFRQEEMSKDLGHRRIGGPPTSRMRQRNGTQRHVLPFKERTDGDGQKLRTDLVTQDWPAHIVAFLLNIELKEMHLPKSNELICTIMLIAIEELLEIGNFLHKLRHKCSCLLGVHECLHKICKDVRILYLQ